MKRFVWAAVTLAALFFSAGAYACNVPNPNLNAPPFVDGCPVPASALNKMFYSAVVTTAQFYGAKGDGTTDDATAIQNCLNAVSAAGGGTCLAGGGRFRLNEQIAIPANTSLTCGPTKPMTLSTGWNTIPALLYTTTLTPAIYAGDIAAQLSGCAVLPYGVTFPISSQAAFGAGVAVSDNGKNDFSVVNDVITGDDSAVLVTGNRPYLSNVNADGTGNTEGVIRWDVGNTDSGTMANVELAQGMFTGSDGETGGALCTAGTGIYVGGTPVGAASLFMVGKIVSEGYQTADYHFANGVIADNIWADDFPGTCTYSSGSNITIDANVQISAKYITADDGFNGLVLNGFLFAHEVNVANTSGDGILLGVTAAPTFSAGEVFEGNITGYALDLRNGSGWYSIGNIQMNGPIHGGALPSIANSSGANIALGHWGSGAHLFIGNGYFPSAQPFDSTSGHSFTYSPGSEWLAQLAVPTTSVSGLGTGGTISLVSGSNVLTGEALLTAGTSPTQTVTFILTAPLPATHGFTCSVEPASSTGSWTAPFSSEFGNQTAPTYAFTIANDTNFIATDVYLAYYNCGLF